MTPPDPYRYFRIEANEIVGQLERGLLDLEHRPGGDIVARLLRGVHTLKGAARIVKHTAIAELAHTLEDVLAPLRSSGVGPLDAAVALVGQISGHVAALSQAPVAVAVTAVSDAAALPRISATLLDDLLGGVAEAHARFAALRGALASSPKLVGAAQLAELDAVGRALRVVRDEAEQLRLLPASAIVSSLERTARDAARASGKQIELAFSGGDARIDAQVLTGLHGALIQLVRNAVAHGIEPPTARLAAGKPAAGRIAVDLRIAGDRVVVRCEDDGGGIDIAAVRAAAIARGLVEPDAMPDDRALIALLLGGGLSTSREVTPLAGRGIGLDVVRAAAWTLGGEVAVRSRPGIGVAISIEVPFAVAAVATLGVVAGDHTVAIPRVAVRRVIGLGRDALAAGTVVLDDASCALVALTRILGGPRGRPALAVVIADGGSLAAVAVDRVLGIEHLVVRATGPAIPVDPVVRGFALDDDGLPRPVLDAAVLMAAVRAAPPEPAPEPKLVRPILVVDDSLTTRMLEQSILEAAGYQVDVAASAELGLAKVAERDYGLYLVDVEMPGLDGFGFVAAIRALGQVPAILVTSRDTLEDRQRGEAVGAQGYLVKGMLDQRELLALVARLLA